MRYRLVIFDFDGTLADTFPWFLQVVNTVADAHGFRRIQTHEVDALRGSDARTIVRHLGIPWWKLPRIARHMRTLAAADDAPIVLFDGADRLLCQLARRGITLAIVTSNTYETVRRALGPETAALIAHYECGTPAFGKRRRFRRVLRATGVPRHEALAIGDEIRDREAAAKEGIAFGAVAWGFTRIEALAADRHIATFARMDDIAAALT
jgi:phosphoglycolate phosphatase